MGLTSSSNTVAKKVQNKMSEQLNEENPTAVPQIVYHPKFKETQLVRFTKFVENKYKINIKDYWELHKWSCENFPEFWDCVWQFFDVVSSAPYSQVYDKKNGFESMEWFKGALLNHTTNILKYRDLHTAIIATDQYDNAEYITYQDLYNEVRLYVTALKDSGVQKGDFITCYMSNKKEAIFAYLAVGVIGAIWCGTLPLLGAKAVISRFEQVKPKILFTAGNCFFQGTEINMLQKIPNVVSGLPSLEKVVFVPSKTIGVIEDISNIPKCVLVSDFLKHAREKLKDDKSELQFEQVPFDYPLYVSFTSGTTGAPKALIHSTGSFFAQLKDLGLHQDITRKDVLINFSPVGWISWSMFLNSLHLGATLCVYDGFPFDESPTRYWDLVDKYGLTSFYMWSSTVADMEKHGHVPTSNHSLKTLRQIFPNGSPAKPQSFNFLTEKVKPNLFCSPGYGTTEVFGLISGMNSNFPVYRGEMQCFSLGMDVHVLDENGRSVVGEKGELVISKPYPSFPVILLNDENKQQMKELYLTKYAGHWDCGDISWINPITKGFIVFGRSDENMNPKGARFSCVEIYFALEGFPGLEDSVCVSQFNSNLDERVVLFVKMRRGHTLTTAVENEIRRVIADTLTVEHVPDIIMETPDIPYNITGKKLNSLVKKLINKSPISNTDVVINPSSVEFFRTVDLGNF